jgi:hypothetical protein
VLLLATVHSAGVESGSLAILFRAFNIYNSLALLGGAGARAGVKSRT